MRITLTAALVLVLATATVAPAAGEIVVKARFKHLAKDYSSITYVAPNGRYKAVFAGAHRFRLTGRINGMRLTGHIRTRQAASRTRYIASGRGRLGGRAVRISGGGPNNLSRATLILR